MLLCLVHDFALVRVQLQINLEQWIKFINSEGQLSNLSFQGRQRNGINGVIPTF